MGQPAPPQPRKQALLRVFLWDGCYFCGVCFYSNVRWIAIKKVVSRMSSHVEFIFKIFKYNRIIKVSQNTPKQRSFL